MEICCGWYVSAHHYERLLSIIAVRCWLEVETKQMLMRTLRVFGEETSGTDKKISTLVAIQL